MLELNRDEYWANENDARDMVRDGDMWCKDGDEFDKAALFDQYMANNLLDQLLRDLHAEIRGDMRTVLISSTGITFKWTTETYKSKRWQKFVATFGKARLWDELVNRSYGGTDVLMERLGYHRVSNEED